MSKTQKIKEHFPPEIRGMTDDQAEGWLLEHGGIPDWWLDPITRTKAREGDIGDTVIEAHLDQFEQAYKGRLGKNARGIGYTRNIEGQGMPNGSKK